MIRTVRCRARLFLVLGVCLVGSSSALAQTETEHLANDGFESGSAGWSRSGDFHVDARFSRPRSGSGYAYLSRSDGSSGDLLQGSLHQVVTLPPSVSSAILSFWYSITTEEKRTGAFDFLTLSIRDSTGDLLAELVRLSNLDSTGGAYARRSLDLAEFEGLTIQVAFEARTDARRPTTFRIDDVELSVMPAPVPTAPGAPAAGPEPTSEAAVDRARELVEEDRFAEAEDLLEGVLESDPDHRAALWARAELYRRSERADDAYLDYQRLVAIEPRSTDAWFWLGTIDRWRGRTTEAVSNYGRALALSDCHRDALKGRSRVYRRLGDLDAAERDLRAALACREDDPTARDLLAEVLAGKGMTSEARGVLAAGTGGAEQERRLGDLELAAERYVEAEEHYRRSLAIEPDNASVLKRLGEAERRQGNGKEALAAYERASALEPENQDTRFWVGNMAYRTGQSEKALEAFDAMLAVDPDSTAAFVGKARVLRAEGDREEALALVDRALASDPDNGDYLILRASLLASLGRREQARLAYRTAATEKPDRIEAQVGLERLGARRSWDTSGRSGSSVLIEGLEDAGLIADGRVITPTRLEYLGEGGVTEVASRLREGLDLTATLSKFRQAIINLDRDAVIYDFDVWSGSVGLDHQLSDRWQLSWTLGGTRYESRDPASIADETRERGGVELIRDDGRSRLELACARAPFIQRGFAGDFDFRIFDRNHFSLGWDRRLSRRLTVELRGAVSTFDDGDTPVFARLGLVWRKGGNHVSLSVRQDPFPARFLGQDQRLEFIDYEAVALGARAQLGAGFRLSGEARAGRFEETIREDVVGGELVEGPLDENTQWLFLGRLEWTPPRQTGLRLGVEYFYDDYEFDVGEYNNLDRSNWTAFIVLANRSADRVRYVLRYERGFLDDERDPDYSSDEYEASLELRLGGAAYRDRSYWLGLEGRYGDNELGEERERYGAYLRVPF